jgi:hypothetical protein
VEPSGNPAYEIGDVVRISPEVMLNVSKFVTTVVDVLQAVPKYNM